MVFGATIIAALPPGTAPPVSRSGRRAALEVAGSPSNLVPQGTLAWRGKSSAFSKKIPADSSRFWRRVEDGVGHLPARVRKENFAFAVHQSEPHHHGPAPP